MEEVVFKRGSEEGVFLNLSTINILGWIVFCYRGMSCALYDV